MARGAAPRPGRAHAAPGRLITALGGPGGHPLPPAEAILLDPPPLITPGNVKKIAQGKFGFGSLFTMSRLMAQSRALQRHSERVARAEEKQARDRLATLLRDLARIDRYERRALSRRRTAVKQLEELRASEARLDTSASGAVGNDLDGVLPGQTRWARRSLKSLILVDRRWRIAAAGDVCRGQPASDIERAGPTARAGREASLARPPLPEKLESVR